MEFRTYGRTGCEVSRLGFGAMRLPTREDGKVGRAGSTGRFRCVAPIPWRVEPALPGLSIIRDQGLIDTLKERASYSYWQAYHYHNG